jgi:uncharacterized protein YdaU (DUF1376 family)
MPLFWGDYLRDTRHLSLEEHGAYLMLIAHYWERGSLPEDDERLARILGITKLQWRKLKPVLSPFFNDDWTHDRIEFEIEYTEEKREKNRKNGEAGGRKKQAKKIKIEGTLSNEIKESDLANATPNAEANAIANALPLTNPTQVIDKSITKKINKKSVLEILSECLPEETALEVIEHRKALKAPLTAGAAKGLVKSFLKFSGPQSAAEMMMTNGWRKIEPEWVANQQRAGPAKQKISAITEAILFMENDHGQSEINTLSDNPLIQQIPRLIGNG